MGLPHQITAPRPTTLVNSARLCASLGVEVVLASETFQYTGSFKYRAAYNVARSVSQLHIITASSGNFGQALAYACALFAKRCTVVMPATAVRAKIDAIVFYGGRVDLVDTDVMPREDRVAQLKAENPDAYIASAYDDPLVIAGNAGLGRELSALDPKCDAIIVPVSGGGIAAGIITGLRQAGTQVPVYGAEPRLANDAARSLQTGVLTSLPAEPPTIADGARVRRLGDHTWPILRAGVESIIEVSEDQIEEAVRMLFADANLKAEPTGALGVAALLAEPGRFAAKRVCCIVTGGNADPQVYARIISRR